MSDEGYIAAFQAVQDGRKVTLAVFTYASADFFCLSIPGKENGLYDCWLQSEGLDRPRPYFKLRTPPQEEHMPIPDGSELVGCK